IPDRLRTIWRAAQTLYHSSLGRIKGGARVCFAASLAARICVYCGDAEPTSTARDGHEQHAANTDAFAALDPSHRGASAVDGHHARRAAGRGAWSYTPLPGWCV